MHFSDYNPHELAQLCKKAAEEAEFNDLDACHTRELLALASATKHITDALYEPDETPERLNRTFGEIAYWACAVQAHDPDHQSWMLTEPAYKQVDHEVDDILLAYTELVTPFVQGDTRTFTPIEQKFNLLQGALNRTTQQPLIECLQAFISRTGLQQADE